MSNGIIELLVELGSDPGHASTVEADMTTEQVLQTMLTENTGRHMLDSGGAYGRNWERNQGVDWDSVPETDVSWRAYEASQYSRKPEGTLEMELMATLNVYPFLRERVDFAPEVDALLQAFGQSEGHADEPWLATMEAFAEAHDADWFTVNTYNGEDALSQVLQYTVYEDDERGEYICLLQIHGGCDVRGGYTAPRAFTVSEPHVLMDNARIEVACDGSGEPDHNPGQIDLEGNPVVEPHCGANWTDEGGSSWLYDGGTGDKGLDDFPVERGTEGKRGVLVIDEDANVAFCPVCGKGKLGVYAPYPCY